MTAEEDRVQRIKEAQRSRERGVESILWRRLSELDPTISVRVQRSTVTLTMDAATAERLAELVR